MLKADTINTSSVPTIATFGYGSLVNPITLRTPYISMHRARVKGWRRVWLPRPKQAGSFAPIDDLAFLSVEQDTQSDLLGMVIVDHAQNLAALDAREALYTRHEIDDDMVEFLDSDRPEGLATCYVYVAEASVHSDAEPRILRSYLDAVLQGYLCGFGTEGLDHFKATSRNGHFKILEDRASPVYPRSVTLTGNEMALIDAAFPLMP